MTSTNPNYVLVTGASRGIGRIIAIRLVQAGFHVFAGVRNPEAAEVLRSDLGEDRVTPLSLDVTDASSVDEAARTVESAVGGKGLAGLVNNAASATFGPVETVPITEVERELAVNVIGPVRMTQACLPLLRRARGRLINVSSVNGFLSIPGSGIYSASKFALEGLSDALRFELRPWGIEVIVVQPGVFGTDIRARALESWRGRRELLPEEGRELYDSMFEATQKLLPAMDEQAPSPEPVAEAVLEALTVEHPQTRYPVGDDMAEYAALAGQPDRSRDAAFAEMFGSS
ncbi:MAG: SDR family oxidoreductase [Longimicrobiales bacterium]